MEVFSTFWGIPIDFASSLTHGQLMKNNATICLTTGMGLALSGKHMFSDIKKNSIQAIRT
jgi:hypothetical protein